MQYEFLTPSSPRWTDTLNRMIYDVYHLPEYLVLNASLEKGDAYAFIAEKGPNTFFFPLIIRPITLALCGETKPMYYDAISAYGYSCPLLKSDDTTDNFCSAALDLFLAKLQERNVVSVFSRLNPIMTCHEKLNKHGELIYHGSTISIDLGLSEEQIWRQMRRNHRNDIKKVAKKGYATIVDDDWQYWDKFLEIYNETMSRNEAEQYYYFTPQYFEQLRQALKGHIHLCVVLDQGEVASGGLFTEVNGIVQYHFSATADKYLTSGSSKALLHFMMLWEKNRGNRIMHIGGGLGANEDSLFKYKAGFSDTRHPFYTWRMISNPHYFSKLVSSWERISGKKADDINGFFPAYRKPISPMKLAPALGKHGRFVSCHN